MERVAVGRMRGRGQTATEYALVLSVIVVAIVAAAWVFVPGFRGGTEALSQDVSDILATGQVGVVGVERTGVSALSPLLEAQPDLSVLVSD